MNTKLTLTLDSRVIADAKIYAKSQRASISKIVETFFRRVAQKRTERKQLPPIVQELAGSVSLPKRYDRKRDYADYLEEKYS